MALIVIHLFNSNDKAEELIINTDHIVSVSAANQDSTNVQLTSGPVVRTTESVAELTALISGGAPVLETKSIESDASVETPAERKARLKAEAEAAKAE